ncbi:membrane-associated protein, putative [Bodo saltans]|uniref:Membrane-associated protein, putative n=1 Tax=Bodo saltans TaxID=75058 RepID=A0A0S4JPQ5_BODSA|nr:membrane-associated protein, putative [Bodo saltans]|eukprot:CUG93508.1 membrane-associated protein, putative [Bodo saltans]
MKMSTLCCALAITLIAHCIPLGAHAKILTYSVTALTATQSVGIPWAQWDNNVQANGTVSPASSVDDSTLFDAVGYSMPYFQQDNLSWYVSSNGFLSPSDAPLCQVFCTVASSGASIYQLTTGGTSDANGAYPSIQLFAGDLNPAMSDQSNIYKLRYSKDVTGAGDVLNVGGVTFLNIPKFTVGSSGTTDLLTAQVELWPNGTIIMRYKQRIRFSFSATIGLAWTPLQNVDLNSYTSAVAIRLSPVLDGCNVNTTCNACIMNTACTWCDSLALCVNNTVVDDYCAVSQRNTCAVLGQPNSQRFYVLNQTSVPPQSADDFFGGNGQSIPNVTVFRAPSWTNYTNPVTLPFDPIGIFYETKWNTTNELMANDVSVTDLGMLSFFTRDQSCAIDGFCPNGDYQYALLGVAGDNEFLSSTTVEVGTLAGNRTSAFCGPSALVNGSCPAALVVRVTALTYDQFSPLLYGYTMLVDATGRIAIRYNRGSISASTSVSMPIVGYPVPSFGLIRDGLTDPSGVEVPWGTVTTGTTLVFTPHPTCQSCGIGGLCNSTSLACVCYPNFQGEFCDECQPGYYGTYCRACPDCGAFGQCIDGRSAYGNCSCTAPYSGRRCEVHCTAAPYACTPGCNGGGGYCQCGTCFCNTSMGWDGPQCTSWSDPCFQRSLDGCPVCTASTMVSCQFCPSSFVCVANPTQEGIGTQGNYSPCNALKLSAGAATCTTSRQLTTTANTTAVVFVLLAFGAVGLLACFLFSCICACRKRRVDALAISAVTGTPDFKFPRREREVVQMVLIPFQGPKGRPVQGIPLKQVPLKVLYQQQLEKKKSGDSALQLRPSDWNTSLSREE